LVAEILRQSKPIIDLTEDIRLKTSKAAVASSGLTPKESGKLDSCQNVLRDSDGNWVTMMHTGNGGGVPGLVVDGVAMGGGSNNGVVIGSGRRHRAGICPVMILDNTGEPMMALGTPGMPVHSTPIVLTNIFEFGMDPYKAVDSPRFWPLEQEQEVKKGIIYKVQVENRITEAAVADLAKIGVQMVSLGTYRWNTGSFQIVWKDKKTGALKGTSDPRRLGYAKGF
jgi:gamma-glutamyltranspeptidase